MWMKVINLQLHLHEIFKEVIKFVYLKTTLLIIILSLLCTDKHSCVNYKYPKMIFRAKLHQLGGNTITININYLGMQWITMQFKNNEPQVQSKMNLFFFGKYGVKNGRQRLDTASLYFLPIKTIFLQILVLFSKIFVHLKWLSTFPIFLSVLFLSKYPWRL